MNIKKRASLLFLICLVLFFGLSTFLPYIAGDNSDLLYLFNSLLVSIPAFFVPAIVFRRVNKLPAFKAPRFPHVMLAAAIGVGCLQLNQSLSCLMSAVFYDLDLNSLSTTSETITDLNPLNMIFSLAIIPPLSEEFLMRGTMLESYRRVSPLAGAIVTSLLFALLHTAPSSIPVYFAIGMLLAAVYLITRNVWLTVTVHFVNNLASVIGALLIKLTSLLPGSGDLESAEAGLFDSRIGLIVLCVFYGGLACAMLIPLLKVLKGIYRRNKLGMYEEAPAVAEPELAEAPVIIEEPEDRRFLPDPFMIIAFVILIAMNVLSALVEFGVIEL